MTFVVCQEAGCTFAVKVQAATEVHLLKEHTCPVCSGELSLLSTLGPQGSHPRAYRCVTSTELFLLLDGMGFPEERKCTPDVIRAALTGGVRSVDLEGVPGSDRATIHSITMDSGVTVFLAASPWGATAYRVREAQPFTASCEEQ